jgi:hypothetical protein
MRVFRNLFGLFLGLSLLAGIASAVAAMVAKGRLESTGGDADDELDIVTIYDNRNVRSIAASLRRVSLLCWYGGATLDLRGATLDPDGATITLRALFGGIRLVVPDGWRIERDLIAVFGGAGDARDQALVATDGPTIRLRGFAIFGGIGIMADAPDLDLTDSIETPLEVSQDMPAAAPAMA